MDCVIEGREILAEVVSSFVYVLDAPGEIDGDSDFFDMGGNSMLAAMLVARLRRAFPARVTVRDVFNASTPNQLTEIIARAAVAG